MENNLAIVAPFVVTQVVHTDLPAINNINVQAFNNPRALASRIFSHQSDEEAAWRLSHTVHEYNSNDDSRWDKLIDGTTGKVVAFGVWQVPRKRGSEEEEKAKKAEKVKAENEFKEAKKFPESSNQRLLDDFVKATAAMREKYVDTEKDHILKLLAVLPEYQSHGCASLLIKYGLHFVDATGARAELEATPQGKPVYETYGFREVDQIVLQLEDYGHEGTQITTCMIRDAQGAIENSVLNRGRTEHQETSSTTYYSGD